MTLRKKENLYIVFFICFTLYWFSTYILVLSNLNLKIFNMLVLGIGGISFTIYWFLNKFTKKEYIYQLILAIILGIAYYMSGMENEGILTFFPALVCLNKISIRKITKSMFYTLLICEVIMLILSVFNVIEYSFYTKIDDFGNKYNMLKIANQHGNPHYIIIFDIISLYIYSYFKKFDIKKCIIIEIILIVFFFLFYSRTGIILGTIANVGSYVLKKKYEKGKITSKNHSIFNYSFLLFYLFVFIVGYFFHNTGFFTLLNKLISSRIKEAYIYFTHYGLTILPRKITYNYICDNTQTYMLCSFGLAFTGLYIYLNDRAIRILNKKGMKIEILFIVLFLLYSYCEVTFVKPFSNFSSLFLIYALYKDREGVMDE